jgi:hypothetical protein
MEPKCFPVVPLNQLKRRTVRKPPRRKKIPTQVWAGCRGRTRMSVDPEPTADRKHPALLAFFFTGTDSLETLWSPSFPLVSFHFAFDGVVISVLAWDCSPAPSNRDGAGSPRVLACTFLLADAKALFWSSALQGCSTDRDLARDATTPTRGYPTLLTELFGADPCTCDLLISASDFYQ